MEESTISNITIFFVYLVCFLLILIPVSYYLYAATSQKKGDCINFDTMFGNKNNYITSIDNSFSKPLRNYYIKSAYNCCCPGNYKNDFVELCALKDILKQGVRWLDVEVFSLNNKPVIAASTTDNYFEKETYNSIPFQDFLACITQQAFGDLTPNPTDPIFIHIRFKSNNMEMYNSLSTIIQDNVRDNLLLGIDYSYGFQVRGTPDDPSAVYQDNLGRIPLNEFINKIVFVVSNKNNYFINTPFYEYVNFISDTIYCNILTEYDVKFNPDIEELTDHNKKNMTFEIPDNNYNPSCPNSTAARALGIQCVGMRYNITNTNMLIINEEFFDQAGYAFVEKPPELTFIEIVNESPAPIPEDQNFGPQSVEFAMGVSGEI